MVSSPELHLASPATLPVAAQVELAYSAASQALALVSWPKLELSARCLLLSSVHFGLASAHSGRWKSRELLEPFELLLLLYFERLGLLELLELLLRLASGRSAV